MTKQELLKKAKAITFNKDVAKLLPNKTMTRRIIKHQQRIVDYINSNDNNKMIKWFIKGESLYQIGDILWAREPAKIVDYCPKYGDVWTEFTDGEVMKCENFPERLMKNGDLPKWVTKKQGIPNGCLKEMARYFYKVTNIRVERLQDISDDDIYDEGIIPYVEDWSDKNDGKKFRSIREGFKHLWNSTAQKDVNDWESNPYVWVIEYERIDYD